MSAIERCYADLLTLESDMQLSGATEGARELLTKGWDRLKELVKKIIRWFKSLPGKIADGIGAIIKFFTNSPNDIWVENENIREFDRLDAEFHKEMAECEKILEQVKALDAEAHRIEMQAVDAFKVFLQATDTSEAQQAKDAFDALNAAASVLRQKSDELLKAHDAHLAKATQIHQQVNDISVYDSFMGVEYRATEADESGSGKTRGKRVNISGLKQKVKSLFQRTKATADSAQKSANQMDELLNQAERSGQTGGKFQAVISAIAQVFATIGRILTSIPRHIGGLMQKLLKRKPKSHVEPYNGPEPNFG